jgi:hypothetical protein
MKNKLLILISGTLILSLFFTSLFAQTYPTIYASVASGAWNSGAVWETFSGNPTNTPGAQGTGTLSTSTTNPIGIHYVYIRSGHTITMGGANRSVLGLFVENGGTLIAGETTARRLQIANGGTGFATPQSWSVTNNGTIGNATDGIYFEPGTYAANVTLTGTGTYTIGRIRLPGNLVGSGNNTLNFTIDQNVTLTQSANYALTAVYNSNVSDNYTLTINAGKTVTLLAGSGYFHNGTTSATTGGNYTYNINGTLDLSGTTGNVNITPLGSAGSVITLNVNGTLRLGSGAFNCDTLSGGTTPVFGKVVLNVNNGGAIDATLASGTFKTGTELGQYFTLTGTGKIKRNVGSTATLFPVGTSSTSYTPVTLTNTGTADSFSVSLKNTFDNAPVLPNSVVNKQWTINKLGSQTVNVVTGLGWLTADEGSAFVRTNTVDLMQYVSGAWNNFGLSNPTVTGSGTFADPYFASSNGFTTFGNFGVTNGTVLPVKFANVFANKINGLVKVSWSIETEINAANYIVERSVDGASFTAIGTVVASNAGTYSYIDASSTNATNYYRIKAVDKDGSFAYSVVVFITADTKTAVVSVYPNPVPNKQINVQLSNLNKGSYNIEVYNNLGQSVLFKTIQFDGGTTSLSLQLPSSLNAGLYRLSVSSDATRINKTISVQ